MKKETDHLATIAILVCVFSLLWMAIQVLSSSLFEETSSESVYMGGVIHLGDIVEVCGKVE